MNPNPTSQSMSLEEARQVPMMFERYQRRTLGSLLDSGELQQRDLVYASQSAFNETLKEAAKVIIQHLQNQLTIANVLPPLNVVSSRLRSYSERKQFQYTFIQGTVVGVLLGICMFMFLNSIYTAFTAEQDPSSRERFWNIIKTPAGMVALGILIILVLLIWVLSYKVPQWLDNYLEKQIQRHRKGQKAEERVLNSMYYALDANWWLFRNLELPNRKGDIDFVLVGQKGVWVFEVKFYEAEFRNRGKEWEAHIGSQWKTSFTNPTEQSQRNAAKLNEFLKAQNIVQWVNPVVVWANPESVLQLENPEIPVWTLDNLTTELAKLDSPKALDSAKMQEIIELLKKLIEDKDK